MIGVNPSIVDREISSEMIINLGHQTQLVTLVV